MSNPTSNFGWQMPTNSDLVTDLPADFEVFGQAVDTSLADLKGGTTGQVLSKATNTDMDFTWVSPTTGDITGVTAGTGITGGGTSGDVTVSFDVANYGGGQYAAGKNKCLNGAFDIWQRGTSFSSPANGSFFADRYQLGLLSGSISTISRQTLSGSEISGYDGQYFSRMAISSAGDIYFYQKIEDVQTLAGKTITVSFYVKTSTATNATLDYAEFEQNFGSGGSASVQTGYSSGTNTTWGTSWTRCSLQFTVPSISGKTIGTSSFIKLRIDINGAFTGNWDFTGLQIEVGSTATPFQTATGTKQNELAACQRYYYRNTANAVNKYLSNQGAAVSTTSARIPIICPVPMRVAPTSVDFANIGLDDGVNATVAVTATGIIYSADQTNVVGCSFTVASGLTQYRNYGAFATSSGGYLGFSSEL